jgi:hypothetical protein
MLAAANRAPFSSWKQDVARPQRDSRDVALHLRRTGSESRGTTTTEEQAGKLEHEFLTLIPYVGGWQGVALDSVKFQPGPLSPPFYALRVGHP